MKKRYLALYIIIGFSSLLITTGCTNNKVEEKPIKEDEKKEEIKEEIPRKDLESNVEEVKKYDYIKYSLSEKLDENKQHLETEIYVKDKKLDIYAITITNINQIDDILIFEANELDYTTIYVVNKDGEIINNFIGNCVIEYKDYATLLKGCMRIKYTIKDNTINITSDLLSQDPEYVSCKKKDDEIVEYTEQFKYLGNNKFSNSEVIKTITNKEYKESKKIQCR